MAEEFESCAKIVKEKLPAADGVPEILPLARLRPAGSSLPDLMEMVTGSTPPVVGVSAVYGVPAFAAGRLEVVIATGSTVMRKVAFFVTDLAFESVTLKTTSKEPAVTGVP